MIEANIAISIDDYPIAACVDGPNGRATRLAFYKRKEDAGSKADYALDFPTARNLQQWLTINADMVRRIRILIER